MKILSIFAAAILTGLAFGPNALAQNPLRTEGDKPDPLFMMECQITHHSAKEDRTVGIIGQIQRCENSEAVCYIVAVSNNKNVPDSISCKFK